MNKTQIFKCTNCNVELDEAKEDVFFSGHEPFCVYCHPLSDELPREQHCKCGHSHDCHHKGTAYGLETFNCSECGCPEFDGLRRG